MVGRLARFGVGSERLELLPEVEGPGRLATLPKEEVPEGNPEVFLQPKSTHVERGRERDVHVSTNGLEPRSDHRQGEVLLEHGNLADEGVGPTFRTWESTLV